MVGVVVVDTGSRFRGAFEAIFSCLQITFFYLARGNHKVNCVEKCHRFLNKTQFIAVQYRGSHDVFIQNGKS